MCSASRTTPTPLGSSSRSSQPATWVVRRSWIWRSRGEELDDATELAQADDPLTGEIPDVRHPMKGQQVMHAQRVKWDRPCDDQLVIAVVVGEGGRPKRLRRQQLGIGIGDAARRLLERLCIDVGAERPQKLASRSLNAGAVDLAVGLTALGWRCERDSRLWRGHVRLSVADLRSLTRGDRPGGQTAEPER